MRPFVVAVLLSAAFAPTAARAADRRLPARVLIIESKGQEGNSGQVVAPVTITQSPGNSATTYAYRTIDGTATAADNDYVPLNGVLTIPAGQTTGQIDVRINGDTKVEGDETFTLEVDGVVNGPFVFTIINDDAPAVTVSGASIREGNPGATTALTFDIALTAAASVPVLITYRTADGTATAGVDYVAMTGSLTFAPGETRKTVDVPIIADTLLEPDETFTLSVTPSVPGFSGPTVTATGTIVNDEPLPATGLRIVSGNNQRGTIGQPLPQPLVVEVLNSAGAPAPGVVVQWTVSSGTAQLTPATSTTDAQGRASTRVTVTSLGAVSIRATVAQLPPVTFDVSAATALADRAEGPVAVPIARALDQACNSPDNQGTLGAVCQALSQLPNGQLTSTLERVAPQESGAQAKVATSVASAVAGSIGSRLAALRSGTERFSVQHLALNVGGRSIPIGALAMSLFAQTGTQDAATAEEKDYRGWSAFLSGSFGTGERIAHDGELGFDLDTSGLMFGVDRQVGGGVLGLSANWMKLDSKLTDNVGSVDTTGYALSLYGSRAGLFAGNAPPSTGSGMHYDGVHIDGSITAGRNRYESEHTVEIPSLPSLNATARSRNNANLLAVGAVTGIEAHNGRTDFDVTLSGTWSRADVDDLTENGAGPLILFVQGHEIESTVGALAVNVRSAFNTSFGSLLPSFRAEMNHEFQSGARLVTARFLRDRLNTSFTIPVDSPDTNYARLAAGLQAVFAYGWAAHIDLTQDVARSDLHYRVVQFNVSKSF